MATSCDMLLALTAHWRMREISQSFLSTVSLQIEHLAPSPLREWVQGEADVLRTTRTMVFAQGPGDGRRRARRPHQRHYEDQPSVQRRRRGRWLTAQCSLSPQNRPCRAATISSWNWSCDNRSSRSWSPAST